MPEFWQNFPKCIESDDGVVRVGLFPRQFADLHELQGGEQKTHTIWFHVGNPASPDNGLSWVADPVFVQATPEWFSSSGCFGGIQPVEPAGESQFDQYLRPVIEGPEALVARREIIDEYGWRNYGDIYADHENAYYEGPKPVISHYNNQYDAVLGAIIQSARTGDGRWRNLYDPLARHVIDIDIYHTERDRASFNGGLFWHTDHYRDAGTCSHRAYSRANAPRGQSYGGGPANEHDFATGLLYYHYLTGDPQARDTVRSLADWVLRMDDGRHTILGRIDSGPTGLASRTFESGYHGPGRGAGFSVNTLLDGWLLTGDSKYLEGAGVLIRRCIHPNDDIGARDLLHAEARWSYTIFLSALARYLDTLHDANDVGFMYAYARAALLRYADWMARNERPYFDQKERLVYPTETWPAQDFRKANVLRLAAAYADGEQSGFFLRRANEMSEVAWSELLVCPSRHVARAVAILMIEGTLDQYFRNILRDRAKPAGRDFDFGSPTDFVPQKTRALSLLRSPISIAKAALYTIWPPSRRKSC